MKQAAAITESPSMQMRSFGPDNVRVSALGLGCGRIGSFNNPMSSADTTRLLEHALQLGVTLFDTADIYGQGDSERALGTLLRGRRDRAFVVSKVGKQFSAKMRLLRPLKPLLKPLVRRSRAARSQIVARRDDVMGTDFSPAYVRTAIDRSLRRLRFGSIDALLLHSPAASDLRTFELDETLASLRKAGKIRHYGVACDDVACLEAALDMPGIALLEIPSDILDAISDNAVASIGRRQIGILVRGVVGTRGARSPAMAVRAMSERPLVTCVIAGTSSREHLEDLTRVVQQRASAPPSLVAQPDDVGLLRLDRAAYPAA